MRNSVWRGAYFFVVLFINTFVKAAELPNYQTGKNHIKDMMINFKPDDKALPQYAQVQGLEDLLLDEVAAFFNCKTTCGHTLLQQELCKPMCGDLALVKRRRLFIKTLIDQPQLYAEINKLVCQAVKYEQEVMELFSDHFKAKTCPELEHLSMIERQNPSLYPVVRFFTTNAIVRGVSTVGEWIHAVFWLLGTGSTGITTFKAVSSRSASTVDIATLGACTVCLCALNGWSSYCLYKNYNNACEKRSKIHALNRLISIAEQLYDLSCTYNLTTEHVFDFTQDLKAQELIQQLQHNRYTHEKSRIFFTPAVHTFLYKLYNENTHLAGLFSLIAEFDMYHAIATTMKKLKNKPHRLCFVSFADQETPYMTCENFWNVHISKPVANNVQLDKSVILTGPNAGGKTTSIRAMLQNIVLGQTFGVAAAEECSLTPYSVIHSYLHISDDIMHGLSLFASEIKRAQAIVATIDSLSTQDKFFFVLDELFTGTVAEDGEQCAYNFIERIARHSNIQFIYATHFDKLKQLGEKYKWCKNLKVDAPTQSENGTFIFPFTLSEGASTDHIGLELAKQANLFA